MDARREREAASAENVRSKLAPAHPTLKAVREFLVSKHDLYSATGLVARAGRPAARGADAALLASYGGGDPAAPPPRAPVVAAAVAVGALFGWMRA